MTNPTRTAAENQAWHRRLAQLTGYPNLLSIRDPERLERLIELADLASSHLVPGAPIRYKAYRNYIAEATTRWEDPEWAELN